MHGEQRRVPALALTGAGPSPRARGAGTRLRDHSSRPGTIPACTGSRTRPRRAGTRTRDHPRVHGEQAGNQVAHDQSSGPSPRARGAVERLDVTQVREGTIPACTGSRASVGGEVAQPGDHSRVHGEQPHRTAKHCSLTGPSRVHGEQGVSSSSLGFSSGPSPRARGAGQVPPAGRLGVGTIPACTGSSRTAGCRTTRCRDHPRVHGEQRIRAPVKMPRPGPSPRARGAVNGVPGRELVDGTIPACTGSRRRTAVCPVMGGDHPRVHGEQPAGP